jgi:predicted AlkP superfamily phosphohydrolase/phosphomutase
MQKLIFLALDGLSWNMIEELIANKQLTNIKDLIDSGSSALLKAEGFLSSPKIFCSIFTGKKVEKHGIRDFYSKEEDLCSEQIWDILNKDGIKVGLYRPLSVWSARDLGGFCIPNPLLLEKETFPQNLKFIGELDKKARSEQYSLAFLLNFFWKLVKFGFPLGELSKIIKRGVLLFFKKGLEERMHLLKEIELIIHTNLYYKLLRKYSLQFTVFFDYSFDTLGHIYWRKKGEKSKYSNIIPKAYRIVDKFVGKVKKYANENKYHLIICSDHGFEKIEKNNQENYRAINILNLLRELGFYYDIYGIYMTGSVVFRLRPNSSGSFKDFERALSTVKCEGKNLFIIKSYEKKLIVKINDFFGDNENLKVELPNNKTVVLGSIIDFNPGHTGTHSEDNGVFIFNGPQVKKGIKINEITPYDITPTILKLYGKEMPVDIDGRVLEEVFK